MASHEIGVNETQDKLMVCNYFDSEMINIVNEFDKELPDIIEDSRTFSSCLINKYYRENLDKGQINDYLEFVLEVVNLTKKHLQEIMHLILNTEVMPKVVDIQCNLVKRSAVISFNNEEKIIFKYNSLKEEQIFNSIIRWINNKLDEEYRLYIRKFVSYDSYGFLENITNNECEDKELPGRFLYTGELLALLYIFNCSNCRCKRIITLSQYPVLMNLEGVFFSHKKNLDFNLSSKGIAQDIIDCSVYNIEFIPKHSEFSAKLHLSSVKQGFQNIYGVVIDNKLEFIELLHTLFDSGSSYFSTIITKIYGLNEGDLKRQLYFLEVQFDINKIHKTSVAFSDDNSYNELHRDHLLNLAVKLGDHVIQKSIVGFDNFTTSRTWISSVNSDKGLILSSGCNNLYEGNSGIALFFLYLGVLTKKEYFIKISIEAMCESISYINNLDSNNPLIIGAFKGISGELYTLSKIYSITKDETIKDVVKKGLTYIKANIAKQMDISFLNGISGILAVLLSIYENNDFCDIKDKVLSSAELAYKSIAANIYTPESITGFGYGNNGIIAVLVRLLNITGDTVIKTTIKELLKIEREVNLDKNIPCKHDWQNGYPGMLLSRLILKQYGYDDELIDIDISKALDFTIKNGFGNNSYYCNGDIGNLEIMEYAAEVLKDHDLKMRCNNTFMMLVEKSIEPDINAEQKHWNNQMSLFKGIIGYGYTLLRKYNNNIVPQILWLE